MAQCVAMSIFCSNLKRVLREREMTIQQLADIVGVRRSYLSRVIHGHHDPSVSLAEKIASACGFTLYELFQPNSKELVS